MNDCELDKNEVIFLYYDLRHGLVSGAFTGPDYPAAIFEVSAGICPMFRKRTAGIR